MRAAVGVGVTERDVLEAQAVIRLRGDLVAAEQRADFSHAEAAASKREVGEWRRAAGRLLAELVELERVCGSRSANRVLELDRGQHRNPGSANMETQRACYRAAVGELEAILSNLARLAATRDPEVVRTLTRYTGVGRIEDRQG